MPPNPRPESKSRVSGFDDLDRLSNADGIISIISRRRATGTLTFAVMKEFDRDGRIETTQFIGEHLIDSYLDMVARTIKRVRELRAQTPEPA